MTKPKKAETPAKQPPPRTTKSGRDGGSIGNTDDTKRGRRFLPPPDNDPDAQERKA
jgi:hypothetical protein